MADISAKDVMALRKQTGLGMMECKKALTETEGDVEKAVELLRKKGLAKAATKAGRTAKEGLIRIRKTDDQNGLMLLVNSETDFVARNDDFQQMVDELVDYFATAEVTEHCVGKAANAEFLEGHVLDMEYKGHTIREELLQATAKIGEKIVLGALVLERNSDNTVYLQDYLHGGKVGVLVALKTGKPETHANEKFQELAKELAMQVAAAMPRVAESVSKDDLDQAVVAKEKEILVEQAKGEGKPPEIAEKMVMGRLNKFYGEVCLLEQPYIREEKQQVKDVLKEYTKEIGDSVEVLRFHRFQLGE